MTNRRAGRQPPAFVPGYASLGPGGLRAYLRGSFRTKGAPEAEEPYFFA
jgi:hypothetical protein